MLKGLKSTHLNNRLFSRGGGARAFVYHGLLVGDLIIVPVLCFFVLAHNNLILLYRVLTGLPRASVWWDKLSNGDECGTLVQKSFIRLRSICACSMSCHTSFNSNAICGNLHLS